MREYPVDSDVQGETFKLANYTEVVREMDRLKLGLTPIDIVDFGSGQCDFCEFLEKTGTKIACYRAVDPRYIGDGLTHISKRIGSLHSSVSVYDKMPKCIDPPPNLTVSIMVAQDLDNFGELLNYFSEISTYKTTTIVVLRLINDSKIEKKVVTYYLPSLYDIVSCIKFVNPKSFRIKNVERDVEYRSNYYIVITLTWV
jgi:hypothetical protein